MIDTASPQKTKNQTDQHVHSILPGIQSIHFHPFSMSLGPWPRIMVGRVLKCAMQKSVLVRCERLKMTKITKRLVTRHRNFMVHDEESVMKVGDTVRIAETRRLSKRKHHKLVEILKSDHGELTYDPNVSAHYTK